MFFVPKRDDHLSLRRRRPFRARRRDPAKNGLKKRPLHGRRLESLESSRVADGGMSAFSTLLSNRAHCPGFRHKKVRIKNDELEEAVEGESVKFPASHASLRNCLLRVSEQQVINGSFDFCKRAHMMGNISRRADHAKQSWRGRVRSQVI